MKDEFLFNLKFVRWLPTSLGLKCSRKFIFGNKTWRLFEAEIRKINKPKNFPIIGMDRELIIDPDRYRNRFSLDEFQKFEFMQYWLSRFYCIIIVKWGNRKWISKQFEVADSQKFFSKVAEIIKVKCHDCNLLVTEYTVTMW